MTEYTCPTCRGRQTQALATFHGSLLRRCPCGHAWLIVEHTAKTDAEMYADDYAGFATDEVFRQRAAELIDSWLVPYKSPPAQLLDVGCGNGTFLELATSAGYQAVGFDVSQAAVDLCQSHGLSAFAGDFQALVDESHGRFDFITLWDVLEHLPDPTSFLNTACQLLAPRGSIVIKTPLTGRLSVTLSARLPRLAGALLQVPHHVQFFCKHSLTRLLSHVGLSRRDWLPSQRMRQANTSGGPRKQAARAVLRMIRAISGDGNLLVMASRLLVE